MFRSHDIVLVPCPQSTTQDSRQSQQDGTLRTRAFQLRITNVCRIRRHEFTDMSHRGGVGRYITFCHRPLEWQKCVWVRRSEGQSTRSNGLGSLTRRWADFVNRIENNFAEWTISSKNGSYHRIFCRSSRSGQNIAELFHGGGRLLKSRVSMLQRL